ncbi:MAG: amidophosphoribosyltransferase [Candidatus Hydrothermales bacterium]
MCGIIGYLEKERRRDLGEIAYVSLEMLQHRGQDAAGIYTFEGRLIKGQGTVDQVFSSEVIKSIEGRGFIGQTRYPTTKTKREAQPVAYESLCMVHNGHIKNVSEILEKFGNPGFETEIDIIAFFSIYQKSKKLEKFAEESLSNLKGGYSLLGIIKDKLLFALRDPYGIRPLFYSFDENRVSISSETIALEKLGFKDFIEVERGSLLIVDSDLNIKIRKIFTKEYKFCSFEIVYFSRTTSKFKGRQIFEYREELGRVLCDIFLKNHKNFDFKDTVISPVPETSRAAAEGFFKRLKERGIEIPLVDVLEKHRYGGRNFIKPSEEIRRRQVFYTLTPIEKNLKQKKIILIDDSIVRGTTLSRMVKILREKGAKEIHLCITYPPIRYSCFYGIDTPTREELIAAFKDEKEVAKEIGADSLTYMTLDGLKEVLGEEICYACHDGSYINI